MLLKDNSIRDNVFSSSAFLPFAHSSQFQELVRPEYKQQLIALENHIEQYLKLLFTTLNLNSVVVLVKDCHKDTYCLYTSCSSHQLIRGPISSSLGVLGCLNVQEKVSLAQYSHASPDIPYYPKGEKVSVGSFCAVKRAFEHPAVDIALCLDRELSSPWTAADAAHIEQCLLHIQDSMAVYYENIRLHLEGDVLRRAFDGLRKLNTALTLDDVYQTICDTVHASIHVDFCAVASVHNNYLTLESWTKAYNLSSFSTQLPIDSSVFQQVLKYCRPFPDDGIYLPTFVSSELNKFFRDFSSFLVLPCFQPGTAIKHVLIVAAHERRELNNCYKTLFALISDQLAIKLDLALSHDQIRKMALQDALTGISNLRAFNTAFNTMFERAQRSSGQLSLVACDIDHFKKVNDNYGHPCGDLVLKFVARTLHNEIRTIDMVARTGGEEFRILLEGASQDKAAEVAERIRGRINNLFIPWQGSKLKVSMSMGVATFSPREQDKELLVSQADQALYEAKNSGRNRVCVWG